MASKESQPDNTLSDKELFFLLNMSMAANKLWQNPIQAIVLIPADIKKQLTNTCLISYKDQFVSNYSANIINIQEFPVYNFKNIRFE